MSKVNNKVGENKQGKKKNAHSALASKFKAPKQASGKINGAVAKKQQNPKVKQAAKNLVKNLKNKKPKLPEPASDDESEVSLNDSVESDEEVVTVQASLPKKKGNQAKPVPAPAPADDSADDSDAVDDDDAEDSEDDDKADTPNKDTLRSPNDVTVFVGNLPINTKRSKVETIFKTFGEVTSIRLRKNNGSRFFKKSRINPKLTQHIIAFVDFKTLDEAKAALKLNGSKIGENNIRVDLQANAKLAEKFDPSRTVFIGNLRYNVSDQNIYEAFSCCGEIEYVRSIQSPKGTNGTAFVCFVDSASVAMALELNKSDILGRPINVERYQVKKLGTGKNRHFKGGRPVNAPPTKAGKQNGKPNKQNDKVSPKKEKTLFSGVKTNDAKKQNKKKPARGPKLLAKKIAPRA